MAPITNYYHCHNCDHHNGKLGMTVLKVKINNGSFLSSNKNLLNLLTSRECLLPKTQHFAANR